MKASAEAANGMPGAMERAAYWAGILARQAKAAEDAWRNARDYGAGLGGRMPMTGNGQKTAV
jgi:hypothetical protein